jgi:hypothetical protein
MSTTPKPIVIGSKTTKPGSLHEWSPMGEFISEFTAGIETQKITADGTSNANISQAISGLPSPYARASMFTYALQTNPADEKKSGLFSFYESLIDEWKGLIASFALAPSSSFNVKRIFLSYSDGDIFTTKNIYEPKGAFGNMLLHKQQLWEDPENIGDLNRIKKPFIDLIYFNNTVVGGTSPESLLFTAPAYKLERGPAFVNDNTQKYTDPINSKGKLQPDDLNTLYSYVKKIQKNLPSFFKKYEQSAHLLPNGIDENIAQRLKEWLSKMEVFAKEQNYTIIEIKPEVVCFTENPFNSIFNAENILYADFQGVIYDEPNNINGDVLAFNPDDLLLDHKTSIMARIEGDENTIKSCPIHLLTAKSTNGTVLFSIPLSELGLKIFERSMFDLIKGKDNNSSSISAVYNPIENNLLVTLELRNKGKLISKIPKTYKCHAEAIGFDQVIIWPNFISKVWNKYYMFSEMPHNSNEWQSFPIMGDNSEEFPFIDNVFAKKNGQGFQISEQSNFLRIAEDGEIKNKELGKLVVGNIRTTNPYKYEIYESNKPFKGIEIRYRNQKSGFIFLNYDQGKGAYIDNKLGVLSEPNPTRVGIDFGSNNSCVAYWDDVTNTSEIIEYKNRRVCLFSNDSDHNEANNFAPAKSFEMMFFQNDATWSNKIKSSLTIHDETRIIHDNKGDNIELMIGEVVKGGFTCFEKNLAIKDSSYNRHMLYIANKAIDVQMVHNMKWSIDYKEQGYKKAFLKMLMLQTYAELLMNPNKSYFPEELVWAYPSAMNGSAISDYSNNIWSKLTDCNPLNDKFSLKIATGHKGTNPPILKTSNTSNANPMVNIGNPMARPISTGGQNILPLELPEEIEQTLNPNTYKKVDLNISKSNDFKACTEALAVANYASANNNCPAPGSFILGFDVGGSTTDLLAITSIQQKDENGNTVGMPSATLVKQNSIRIAAGTIADATKIAPGFNNLLKRFVQESKMGEIYGLENINENTAPFFYNQIVDRLNTSQQLDKFYKEIAANCKPLMWLNLYQTGLIIYYAGMVARKLRTLTETNKDIFGESLSNLTIEFYGKGSRIFDWFKAVNSEDAYMYYLNCFSYGYGIDVAGEHFNGGQDFKIANFNPDRNFNNNSGKDNVKVEVAKGLAVKSNEIATTTIGMGNASQKVRSIAEAQTKLSEIIGEDGYVLRINGQEPISLSSLMDINPSLIQRLGADLMPPIGGQNKYPRFSQFITLFHQYSTQFEIGMTQQDMLSAVNSINVIGEIKNDEGYKQALTNKDGFDFVAPLFIIQGQAFMKNFLLPKIQRG